MITIIIIISVALAITLSIGEYRERKFLKYIDLAIKDYQEVLKMDMLTMIDGEQLYELLYSKEMHMGICNLINYRHKCKNDFVCKRIEKYSPIKGARTWYMFPDPDDKESTLLNLNNRLKRLKWIKAKLS